MLIQIFRIHLASKQMDENIVRVFKNWAQGVVGYLVSSLTYKCTKYHFNSTITFLRINKNLTSKVQLHWFSHFGGVREQTNTQTHLLTH